MKQRLRAIAHRRASLRAEIDDQRTMLRERLADLRNDVALAGLGFLASRLVARHRWLRRTLMFGGLAALVARHVATRGRRPA
jgi:hypothetical protein